MPLSALFSGSVTEEIIQSLIDEGVEEFKHLDYKEQLNLGSDSEKKEFAKDVSAFANSGGGVLVYGVREENHKPVEIVGINPEEVTKEQIENVILSCISPRIYKQIIPVNLNGTCNQVFVIIIDQSSNAPHMVTKGQDNRYYKRHDFSSMLMEEYEVRYLFERGNSMINEIEALMKKKQYGLLDPNNAGETWLTLLAIPMILKKDRIRVSDASMRDWLNPNDRRYLTRTHSLLPGLARPSLEGFTLETRILRGETYRERFMIIGRESYVQYSTKFHTWQNDGEPGVSFVSGVRVTDITIEFLNFISDLLSKINYYGTVKILLAINNLPNRTALFIGPNAWPSIVGLSQTCDERAIQIVEEKQLIEITENARLVAKSIVDQFYNAFGHDHCQRIGEDGSIIELNWCPLGEGYR